MAEAFIKRGFKVVSDGTDNHLFLLDLSNKGLTGKDIEAALGSAYITVNKNAVPGDKQSPFVTSGIRIGTPAVTTRGFKEAEVEQLANWIADILENPQNAKIIEQVKQKVLKICAKFPVYTKL
jgi:glycine hydroxymethyltransferase